MLRTKVDAQESLWETLLPPECLALPPGLEQIDRLLDDPVFFEPFVPHFDPRMGRPSIPMEVYLRMMHLRYRYNVGFETLSKEVADSFSWRRFCRIGIADTVPHPSTLEKITTRCGEQAISELNEALLRKAAAAHLVKLDKVRADTTVIEANVAHPSDAGLLAKGVAKLARSVRKLKEAGYARRTRFRDRTRSVRRLSHSIGAWLRRRSDQAKEEVLSITAEIVRVAEASVKDAQVIATNARRALRRAGEEATGKAKALVDDLDATIGVIEKVISQTHLRLEGQMPDGSTRVVSLHDTDARPIAKGRIGRPVEFGYKGQVLDNAQGIVLDHEVVIGNPPDAPMLAPTIRRVKSLFGRVPRQAAADRGYGEQKVEDDLHAIGVKYVAIPRKGRPRAERRKLESSKRFRKLVKWRTGSEGRISHLKHSWAWNRTLMDGIGGARTWCGWGIFAHNATKITALIEEKDTKCNSDDRAASPSARATGPPGPPRPPTKRAA